MVELYDLLSKSSPSQKVRDFLNDLDLTDITALKGIEPDQAKLILSDLKIKADRIRVEAGYDTQTPKLYQASYFDILMGMCLAGLLSGVLANLRGFFEFYRESNGLPPNLVVPYMIRPYTGMLSGLFAYFLTSVVISTTTAVSYTHLTLPTKRIV